MNVGIENEAAQFPFLFRILGQFLCSEWGLILRSIQHYFCRPSDSICVGKMRGLNQGLSQRLHQQSDALTSRGSLYFFPNQMLYPCCQIHARISSTCKAQQTNFHFCRHSVDEPGNWNLLLGLKNWKKGRENRLLFSGYLFYGRQGTGRGSPPPLRYV